MRFQLEPLESILRGVNQALTIDADTGRSRRRGYAIDLAAVAVVCTAYSITLGVARDLTLLDALAAGAANTVPVLAFGAVARRVIIDHLVGRRPGVLVAGHVLIGAAFALLAYWLVTVLLGVIEGVSATHFQVKPFPSRAMAYQLLQNVTTYGVIAALSHLQARPEPVTVLLSEPAASGEERSEGLSRYFIRSGEDILPIDVNAIVSIAGADDYAEVVTIEGRHLVRMTLAELEKALDTRKFIRVHRSRIVNVERIARAEPAGGGRILLHMEDGEMIQASRTGSKLLKERVL